MRPENTREERCIVETRLIKRNEELQVEGGEGAIATVISWDSAFRGTGFVNQPPPPKHAEQERASIAQRLKQMSVGSETRDGMVHCPR